MSSTLLFVNLFVQLSGSYTIQYDINKILCSVIVSYIDLDTWQVAMRYAHGKGSFLSVP